MKKLFAATLASAMLLCSAAHADLFNSLQTLLQATPMPEATVTETATATEVPSVDHANYIVKPTGATTPGSVFILAETVIPSNSSNYVAGEYYAVVMNDSSAPVTFDEGRLVCADGAGNILDTDDYVNVYPSTILPGEFAIVQEYYSLRIGSDIPSADTPIHLSLELDIGKSEQPGTRLTVQSSNITCEELSYRNNYYVNAELVNESPEAVKGILAPFVLMDGEKNLIKTGYVTMSEDWQLLPGKSIYTSFNVLTDRDKNLYNISNLAVAIMATPRY